MGTKIFQVKGKLAPRYVGPFQYILREQKYSMHFRYQIHSWVFMMYFMHLNSIQVPIDQLQLQDIELDQNLSYKENPIAILDFSKRQEQKS